MPSQILWHPFADMSRIPGREVVFTRGEGSHLYDETGKWYLDLTAGLWFAAVGHGRAEIADAAAEQMRTFAAYSTFDVYASRPALALCEKLASLAPFEQCAVFLTSGGSDAVDTAAKMVRRYWQLRGETDRTIIVGRSQAYHGMNAYGTSLAGIPANANGWGSIVPDVVHVPHDDVDALADVLARHGNRIAAFIGEPVIGAGGIIPPDPGYWAAVQKLCREHDVLLIADEVITGFGRLGTWFASEYYDIHPDIIVAAKGITSGYLPLGAVLVGERVRDTLWAPEAGMFRHGYTYSGHPVACAAALVNLEIMEREDLLGRVKVLTPVLSSRVDALVGLDAVEESRSAGLLGTVQLAEHVLPSRPQAVEGVVERLRERGFLVRGLVGHSFQISPPFIITEDELDRFFDGLAQELADLQCS